MVGSPLFTAFCFTSGFKPPGATDALLVLVHAWMETRVEPTPAPEGLVTNLGGTGSFASHSGLSES